MSNQARGLNIVIRFRSEKASTFSSLSTCLRRLGGGCSGFSADSISSSVNDLRFGSKAFAKFVTIVSVLVT